MKKRRKRKQASLYGKRKKRLNPILPRSAELHVRLLESSTLKIFGDESEVIGFAMMKSKPLYFLAHSLALDIVQKAADVETLKRDMRTTPIEKQVTRGIKFLNITRLIWKDIHIILLGLDEADIQNLISTHRHETKPDWKEIDRIDREIYAEIVRTYPNGSIQEYERSLHSQIQLCIDNIENMVRVASDYSESSGCPFTLDKTQGFYQVNFYLARWVCEGIPHFWSN